MTPEELKALKQDVETLEGEWLIGRVCEGVLALIATVEAQQARLKELEDLLNRSLPDEMALAVENVQLKARLAALEQERDELKQAVERFESLKNVDLVSAGPRDDGFVLSLASEMWPLICNALALWFVRNGGKNYIEFKAEYDAAELAKQASITGRAPFPVGPFVITMQRLHGKSPNDLRMEAEALATQWRERAERAEARADEAAPRANRFDCVECGRGVAVDEDGGCRTCGRDAQPVLAADPHSPAVASQRGEPMPAFSTRAELARVRERELCCQCEGNGVLPVRNNLNERIGVRVCPTCNGRCWADPSSASPSGTT